MYVKFALIAILLLASPLQAQTPALNWHNNLASAKEAARHRACNILLFFSAPNARLSQSFETLFQDPVVQAELSYRFEVARFPVTDYMAFAKSMGAFKAGSIVICNA